MKCNKMPSWLNVRPFQQTVRNIVPKKCRSKEISFGHRIENKENRVDAERRHIFLTASPSVTGICPTAAPFNSRRLSCLPRCPFSIGQSINASPLWQVQPVLSRTRDANLHSDDGFPPLRCTSASPSVTGICLTAPFNSRRLSRPPKCPLFIGQLIDGLPFAARSISLPPYSRC